MRTATTIRLLSWNLLHRAGADADDVARLVEAHDPDLVLLQEAGRRLDALSARFGGHYERAQMGIASTDRQCGAGTQVRALDGTDCRLRRAVLCEGHRVAQVPLMYDAHVVAPVLTKPVKLVVWDLDDTFWRGTLAEGGATPVAENIDLVKRLAARGIISSICSKNDRGAVALELQKLGVWDYFILPSISFQPKGSSIAALIEALQLRPANTVFIDDNPSVLAEAGFNCPGLVCLSDPSQLAVQLDSDPLRGSADPEMKRLAQYKRLADRHDELKTSGLNNEQFLRQSEISIEIDYAVEQHLDRVIELVNRSNQLNYTKARLETDQEQQDFRRDLTAFGFNAGIVRLSDKYADYGIIGFFMTLATLKEYKLVHFVFSCRVMNMGVEQYVYDYLNRPSIVVAGRVANPIVNYPAVDWIKTGVRTESVEHLKTFKLVLIGGCDMLQMSTYCSMDTVEFTNRDARGLIKRLDDPFLILDDPERVRQSALRPHIPAFDAQEMIALQTAARDADAVVVSFYRMMEINYFRGRDELMVRLDEDAVKAILASDQALWFVRNFTFVELTHEQRQDLIRRSLASLARMLRQGGKVIVLLENVRKLEQNANERNLRDLYNNFIKQECEENDQLTFLDINTATSIDWLWDDGFHMDRQGYYELAQSTRALIEGFSPHSAVSATA